MLKHQKLTKNDDYVHLLNALCWNYTSEDHGWLSKVALLQALLMGNEEVLHPLRSQWGRADLLFGLQLQRKSDLCLPSFLWQAFNFVVCNILETIFVKQEREQIDHGAETSQEHMITS